MTQQRLEIPIEERWETIEGVLERIVYANEETAWSVVKLAVEGRTDLVTAVGSLLGIQPGENLRLRGRWMTDRRYGEQFRVDSYLTIQPGTRAGIEKYLGSGLIRGIGRGLAQRLVEHFGIETLDVIEADPDRLVEVDGIGPVRKDRIRDAWDEQRAIKDVMLFLQTNGVTTSHAIRIYKTYRDQAIATVKENPYRLALDIFGIGFLTADRIARNLGIPVDSPRRAEAGVLHLLGEMSDQGHLFSPREVLIREVEALLGIDGGIVGRAIEDQARAGHLVIEAIPGNDDAVYLRSLHAAESAIATLMGRLSATATRPIRIEIDRALEWFQEQAGITLADAQREAIRSAIEGKVTVITGGPGTGKTTLISGIIQILCRKKRRILLAAPTGRAARRMQDATGQEAKTIHRLLEFSPKKRAFQRDQTRPLQADLVIIDEVSMVDALLAQSLLSAIPASCQLIFVGDVDQLPSVGPGSVLREIIDSGTVNVIRLTEIFRQAERSRIVTNAHRVNQGYLPQLDDPESETDFFFIERNEPEEILGTCKKVITQRIPRRFGLDPLEDVQILTPMHKGLLGATNLNAEFQQLLNPAGTTITRGSRTFRVGDRVLQIRNNYELEVFNGDIGRVTDIDELDRRVSVRYDDRRVGYDYSDLDELMLAYACSIHKAQGSEYPCVVVPLHTQHYVMLQRNLLYTAITRGRRLVVLVGSRKALGVAVRNHRVEMRNTRLADRLRRLSGIPRP